MKRKKIKLLKRSLSKQKQTLITISYYFDPICITLKASHNMYFFFKLKLPHPLTDTRNDKNTLSNLICLLSISQILISYSLVHRKDNF